ncbi:MAG: hypothetical protein U0491_00470 [Candidatus Saccharimonadales bacterium]
MSVPQFEKSGEGIEKIKLTAKVGSDEVPFTIERPDRRHFGGDVSDHIVLDLTGWTESEDSLKPLRTATAKLGMAAATLYHPRYVNPIKVFRSHHLRVENVAAVVRKLEGEYASVSLAGHSFGGIDGTRATYEKELDIRVLALLGSAGLIQLDNLQHVAPRVLNEVVFEEGGALLQHPIHEGRFAVESVKVILRNPILAGSEGLAAANQYVGRHIESLTERGVVVLNVMADGDKIFPYKDVQLSTEDVPFDGEYIVRNANHNFTYNRADEVAGVITQTITDADTIVARRVNPLTITNADVEQDLFGVVY